MSTAKNKIRTIFMGTPEFACPGLQALIDSQRFEIVGIFTQPDRPVGRRQVMTPPPVKDLAQRHSIAVFQPLKIKHTAPEIADLFPELIVVIAYGQIIPQSILDIPAFGCINVHASLLPRYRGAACLTAPILNGDEETGITIMKMDSGLDTGPILRQTKIHLAGTETLPELHDRLSELGASLLPQTLEDWVDGKIEPKEQDSSLSSYVPTLDKEDGRIDWKKSAPEIERQVRALNPWPGTFSAIEKESSRRTVKILEADRLILKENGRRPGELFLRGQSLAVQCGQDSLVILKLQIAGGKPLNAAEFLAGNAGLLGTNLS